jgi:hypothetical protein
MSTLTEAQKLISDAREILEEIGETCPAYVSFEKEEYTLNCEQVKVLAKALYFADCEIMDLLKNLNNNGKTTI